MVAVAEVLQAVDLVLGGVGAAKETAGLLVEAVAVEGEAALGVLEGVVASGVDAAVLFSI